MESEKLNQPFENDSFKRLTDDMEKCPEKYTYITAWQLSEQYVRDLLANKDSSEEEIFNTVKGLMLKDKSLPFHSKDPEKNQELIEAVASLRKPN